MRRSAVLTLSVVLILSAVSAPAAGQSANFTGQVELTGDAAADGTQYQYHLDNTVSINNLKVRINGSINRQYDNITKANVGNGETINLDVGGNKEPLGPSDNNEPTVDITGKKVLDGVFLDGTLQYVNNAKDVVDTGVSANRIGGAGDVDTDGDIEIVYISSGIVKTTDLGGSTTSTGYEPNQGTPTVGDLDNDGDDEIVFVNDNLNIEYTSESSSQGTISTTAYDVGGVGDVDGDGSNEVSYDTLSTVGYADPSGGDTDTGVSANKFGGVGDIDNDGTDEMVFSDSNENIKYTDSSGSVSNLFVDTQVGKAPGGVGDINSDGQEEVLYQNGGLYHVDKDQNSKYLGVSASGVGPITNIRDKVTKDPAIDIDGDGADEVSISGELTGTVTREIPSLSLNDTADVSTSSGFADFEFKIKERTVTNDPSITINQNTASHSGILSSGTSKDLAVSDSWIKSGLNNVSVSTNSPSNGPAALVELYYRHDTTGGSESITVSSTEWQSTINSSKTFESDRSDVVTDLKFSDNIISVVDIEYQINGGSWQTPPSWSMSNSVLSVDIGSVNNGDQIRVRAEGRRIDVLNGGIEITDPTLQGDELATKIKIESPSQNFGIDTSGTSDQIHYAAQESWDSSEYVELDTTGDQIIRLPNAVDGSTARLRRAPVSMSTSDSTAAIRIVDPDTPEWSILDKAGSPDSIDIDYLDPLPDREYELYSVTDERAIRTSEEGDGIVELRSDGRPATYLIQEANASSGAVVAVASEDSSSPLSILALLLGVGGSLVGSVVVGRRFGIGGTRTRLLVGSVVGVVGVELATGRSLISDLLLSIQQTVDAIIGPVLGGGPGTLVTGVLILIGIAVINRRFGLPNWLVLSSGILTGIWMLDNISGGILTGSLEELGPLLWILLLGGGTVLLYRALDSRDVIIGGDRR